MHPTSSTKYGVQSLLCWWRSFCYQHNTLIKALDQTNHALRIPRELKLTYPKLQFPLNIAHTLNGVSPLWPSTDNDSSTKLLFIESSGRKSPFRVSFSRNLHRAAKKNYNFLAIIGEVVVGRYLDSLYRGARKALGAWLLDVEYKFSMTIIYISLSPFQRILKQNKSYSAAEVCLHPFYIGLIGESSPSQACSSSSQACSSPSQACSSRPPT